MHMHQEQICCQGVPNVCRAEASTTDWQLSTGCSPFKQAMQQVCQARSPLGVVHGAVQDAAPPLPGPHELKVGQVQRQPAGQAGAQLGIQGRHALEAFAHACAHGPGKLAQQLAHVDLRMRMACQSATTGRRSLPALAHPKRYRLAAAPQFREGHGKWSSAFPCQGSRIRQGSCAAHVRSSKGRRAAW